MLYDGLEQIVHITPAFDRRHSDPSKDYGIGACRIWFYIKGPEGAVQFQINTNWYVPSAIEHLKNFGWPNRDYDKVGKPEGWDVGYHSYKPMYEGQSSMECSILEGECYYDGSSLLAEEWLPDFVAGGTDWLWPKLRGYYQETFLS